MKTAIVVTTYQRPHFLARSLPQIVAAAKEVGAPVLVVDDGSDYAREDMEQRPLDDFGVKRLWLPENRGLAGALNIGLSYWMADPSIEVIHCFQDDVEVDPLAIAACNEVLKMALTFVREGCCVTGHDAAEHKAHGQSDWNIVKGIASKGRKSCRATHMAARRSSWQLVMPIPSRGLGLPSKTIRDAKHPERRGTGSGVDWWIVRDSPNKLPVICVPGLVRSFAHKREDSTWDNESIAGEEPPLSRGHIKVWVEGRKK